jgi:O-antigen/teichoic acid export membrane protein
VTSPAMRNAALPCASCHGGEGQGSPDATACGTEGVPTAPPSLALRYNFAWTFTGNAIYAGAQWGTLVALAKLGTPEIVGQYALGLAVTAPVFMLANLQLRDVQATDVRGEYEFADYMGLRIVGVLLALVIVAVVALVMRCAPGTTAVVLVVAVSKAFEALSDIIYGRLQRHERMDRIAQGMMAKGVLSLLALGVGVWLTHSLLCGVAALAAVMGLRLVTFDAASGAALSPREPGEKGPLGLRARWVALRPRFEPTVLLQLARLAFPLGIVAMLISLNASIPRYFIQHRCGEAELGVFAALAYLNVAASMVESALGVSAIPRLARHYSDRDVRRSRRIIGWMLTIAAGVGGAGIAVSMVWGKTLLALFYTPQYASRADMLVWLMVAGAIGRIACTLHNAATAARAFKNQARVQIIETIATVALAVWLIPAHGAVGGAWVMCGSACVFGVGSLCALARAWRQPVDGEAGGEGGDDQHQGTVADLSG